MWWEKDGAKLVNVKNGRITYDVSSAGENSWISKLMIKDVTTVDNGVYTFIAVAGKAKASASVQVKVKKKGKNITTGGKELFNSREVKMQFNFLLLIPVYILFILAN